VLLNRCTTWYALFMLREGTYSTPRLAQLVRSDQPKSAALDIVQSSARDTIGYERDHN
jgi:hypothetical protein